MGHLKQTSFFSAKEVVLGFDGKPFTREALSFSFPSGCITALVGRNGAGKTTLIRAVLGENVLVSGKVFLMDRFLDIQKSHPREYCRYLSFVPQEHTYPLDLKLEALLFLAYLPEMGFFKKPPLGSKEEVEEVLEFFDMSGLRGRPLRRLSTGERQKAFLAHAMLRKPKILILDEPTNHLDPGAVHAFWRYLLKMRVESGLDILISTHDMGFVKRHCEWVCALDKGNLFYNGPVGGFWSESRAESLFGITDDLHGGL